MTQMSPVHTGNLVANSGNTAYGVERIVVVDGPVIFQLK